VWWWWSECVVGQDVLKVRVNYSQGVFVVRVRW